MAEVRIRREEIKGIAKERESERDDAAADINEGCTCDSDCDCDGGACEWHDD